jgi:DNA repair exonuclease SbcCD ATPase subunit
MIEFKVVRYKNFFATGNAFTEIPLNVSPTNLVVGKNGDGKSSIIESIVFCLYGRAYRNINKPQVVNSINKKNCVVELEFAVNGVEYKVVRGLKPAVFQIWKDGVLLNQDASARDYQTVLEEQILRVNYKSFTQIIVLGSASYIPFMQLTPTHRREVIEDLLDIKIFSEMNEVLKERVSEWKEAVRRVDSNLVVVRESVAIQQRHVEAMAKDLTARRDDLEQSQRESEGRLDAAKTELQILQNSIAELGSVPSYARDIAALQSRIQTLDTRIEKAQVAIANPKTVVCETCQQKLPAKKAEQILADTKDAIRRDEEARRDAANRVAELEEVEATNIERRTYIQTQRERASAIQAEIQHLTQQLGAVTSELARVQVSEDTYSDEKGKLKEMARRGVSLTEEKNTLIEEKDYLDAANVLLKDSGIKTKVIRQYVPVINKLVNKYLRMMDFFVSFELDDQFNEHIKSRHRDDFSYESFSEGEKQRIDLALTFTWRAIAEMKNSAHANLFFLDEVFDSSLDMGGTDTLLTMINTLGNKNNVWVISHKGDHLHDKFTNILKFEKKNNFSVIVPV